MSVPLTLLGLLEREPSHGYDLKRDYDAFFGRGKQLPFGQVYATLGRLSRDGMVIAGDAEPGDGSRAGWPGQMTPRSAVCLGQHDPAQVAMSLDHDTTLAN